MKTKNSNHWCALLLAAWLLPLGLSAQNEQNCFGILAGRLTTVDGSVLLGHNEDDEGEQMLNMYVAPRDEARGTVKFLWAEFVGQEIADAFMNEYGVSVVSDNCPSQEEGRDFTDGGILYKIRFDVAKYAHSAREAVKIIARNVEQYGYRSSGRTYIVADAREGWLVSLVQGRRWVAQRVPDDKVMTIPNYYVLDKINLADTLNFMGSSDIVSYAISRGWYNPDTDGEFSFRRAYAAQWTINDRWNQDRHAKLLKHFLGENYAYDVNTVGPFLTPQRKLGVQDIIDALSIHYDADTDGHEKGLVCNNNTVISVVCQMRSNLPPDVANIMWTSPGRPCSEVFVPWYIGMTQSPAHWTRFSSWQEAEQKHFTDAKDLQANYPQGAYWPHVDRWIAGGKQHSALHSQARQQRRQAQQSLFEQQQAFEKKCVKQSPSNRAKAMNRFVAKLTKQF